MKKITIYFLILTTIVFNLSAQSKSNVLLYEKIDTKEQITADMNERGIITRIKGDIAIFSETPTTITEHNKKNYSVELKYCFMDGNFNFNLIEVDDGLIIETINHEDGTVSQTKIVFGDKDILLKDDFVTIKQNDKNSFESYFEPYIDSVLPLIEFEDNIAYRDVVTMHYRANKCVYNNNTITIYSVGPGDIWWHPDTFKIGNFKSEDRMVNLINYVILNFFNERLGCALFPLLLTDFVKS